MHDSSEDTVDWIESKSFAGNFFAPHQRKFDVGVAAATHTGKVRYRNEDHHAVIRRTRSSEILLTNLEQDKVAFPVDEAYFLVVADGIGGAAFGDVASRLALKTILELSSRATSWVMKFTDLDAQELRQRIDAYIEQIQERFRECNHVDPRLRGMGTTLTCVCVLPAHAVFVQIGDSRAYLHRGGELSQLTRDQTLAQDLVDKGAVPTDVKKFGHMLTNSLGGDNGPVEAEVIHLDLLAGDRIMLCSDGLSDMVDDTEIADILKMDELQPACDRLVQSALDHGGKDNITVVLCDLKNPQVL